MKKRRFLRLVLYCAQIVCFGCVSLAGQNAEFPAGSLMELNDEIGDEITVMEIMPVFDSVVAEQAEAESRRLLQVTIVASLITIISVAAFRIIRRLRRHRRHRCKKRKAPSRHGKKLAVAHSL